MLVRLSPSFQSHASPSSRLAPPSVPSPAPSGRGRGEAERRLSGGHTHPQLQLGTSHTHPQLDSCHAHPLLDQLQLHKLELAPAPGKHKEAGQADSAQLQVRCRPVTRALQTFPLSTLLQVDERTRLDLSVVVLLCCCAVVAVAAHLVPTTPQLLSPASAQPQHSPDTITIFWILCVAASVTDWILDRHAW